MTEQELRALVREAIARHLSGSTASSLPRPVLTASPLHPSHSLLRVLDGSQTDGPCIIEPAVPCHHCGYCKSYGH